jgi:TetR/AcrR family transcriptional repressor of lmrAB and yxaGH operons
VPRERSEEGMKKGEETKRKLVAATAVLLQRKGFHATGLSDIVAESGAPRGSIYFYFPDGKESLACAALDESGERWREAILAVVASEPDPAKSILAVCTFLAASLDSSDYEEGCPLATVALEAAASSEAVRATVSRHYRLWTEVIAERLLGAGIPHEAASRLSTFVLSTIEGALLLSKVHRSKQPLLDAGAMLATLASSLGHAEPPPAPRRKPARQ